MDLLIVPRAEKSSPPFQLDNCNYCAGESYGASSIEPQAIGTNPSIHPIDTPPAINQTSHAGITNIDNVHSKNQYRGLITRHPSGRQDRLQSNDQHLLCQTTGGWPERRLVDHTPIFNAAQSSSTHLREAFSGGLLPASSDLQGESLPS